MMDAEFAIQQEVCEALQIAGSDATLRQQLLEFLLIVASYETFAVRDIWPQRAVSAARVIEGVKSCLLEPEFVKAGSTSRRGPALSRAAKLLLHAARGPAGKSLFVAPTEMGRLAVEVRAVVRAGLRHGRGSTTLATAIDRVRTTAHAELILPGPSKSDERVAAYALAIRECENLPTDTIEEYSTRLVVACARAAGFRRPSRLFQFEDKDEKRRLAKQPRT